MQNPFVYGEVVPASAFVDRVDELDRLTEDLAASQKVFLISPRRYGKSSLIRRALAAMTRRGPHAQLVEFAGIGHAPTLIADDQVDCVTRFLLAL